MLKEIKAERIMQLVVGNDCINFFKVFICENELLEFICDKENL